MPPLAHAAQLDQLYAADGWLETSLQTLLSGTWDPQHEPSAWPARAHFVRWPAAYGGKVWIKVMAADGTTGLDHRVRLEWGPWSREVCVPISLRGVVITTGKAVDRDGVSHTLALTCDRLVHVVFGVGEPRPVESAIVASRGWNPIC